MIFFSLKYDVNANLITSSCEAKQHTASSQKSATKRWQRNDDEKKMRKKKCISLICLDLIKLNFHAMIDTQIDFDVLEQ